VPASRLALSGYGRRLRLLVTVGAAVFATDQATKLAAAAYHPHWYVHHAKPHGGWWIPLAMALAVCLLPALRYAAAGGIWVGGAVGNVLDVYAWPGGVPDFIRTPWPDGIWNLADGFIFLGAITLGALVVTGPFVEVRRRRRQTGSVQSASRL
jgi:hypothetical protein